MQFRDPTEKPPPGAQIDWGHPLARGLVGCWLFHEGAGSSLANLCGDYGRATPTGGIAWRGLAARLDGTTGYALACGNDTRLQPGAFSVAALLKTGAETFFQAAQG